MKEIMRREFEEEHLIGFVTPKFKNCKMIIIVMGPLSINQEEVRCRVLEEDNFFQEDETLDEEE